MKGGPSGALRVGRVYAIDWLDHWEATAGQAWSAVEEIDARPVLIRSVGFVVKVSEETVVVAHTLQGGETSTPFVVLRSAILAVHEVKLPPLRRPPAAGKRGSS